MGLLGFDISNNHANANMPLAKAQGASFCIAKASQGWQGGPGGWMDWTWVDIVTRARAAGILPGGYHWMLKGNGAAQADLFIQSLSRAGGPKGFLCGIDIEENEWDQTLNVDPPTVDAFLAQWDRRTGNQPILLYGAGWYHDGYMHAGVRWPTRPLWVAQYNGAAGELARIGGTVTPGYMTPFGGWTSYAIRQFTDAGSVGGETVDTNITYLTMAELQAMTRSRSAEEFTMDAEAEAAFKALNAKVDSLQLGISQLVTVIQGVQPGKPNPFHLVGTQDLTRKIDTLAAEVTAVKGEVDLIKAKVAA